MGYNHNLLLKPIPKYLRKNKKIKCNIVAFLKSFSDFHADEMYV